MNSCRLCGGNGSDFPIFSDSNPDCSKWATRIEFTLSIQVKSTDQNKTICRVCMEKVLELYEFKRGALILNSQNTESCKDSAVSKSTMKTETGEKLQTFNPFSKFNSTNMMIPQLLPWQAIMPIGTPIPVSFFNDSIPMTPIVISPPSLPCTKPQLSISPLKPSTVSHEDTVSNDSNDDVNDIIEQVTTDEGVSDSEKDCKKSDKRMDSGKSNGTKDDESDEMKDAEKSNVTKHINKSDGTKDYKISDEKKGGKKMDTKRDFKKSDMNDSDLSAESNNRSANEALNEPLSATPIINRARRGRKRRGSCLGFSGRRRYPKIEAPEPKTSGGSTGRSLRARPVNKVIVESDNDGDPDDPADFSTTLRKRTVSSSSSDSSSDNKTKKGKIEMGSEILKGNRAETEQNGEENKKPIQCIVCPKRLNGSKTLHDHMAEHIKKLPTFECKICYEAFPDKGSLICHNALSHRSPIESIVKQPDRKKLHCDACDEDFANSGELICHQVLHHKKK